jgi:hypothetical protein
MGKEEEAEDEAEEGMRGVGLSSAQGFGDWLRWDTGVPHA